MRLLMITALSASLSLSLGSCASWKQKRDITQAKTETIVLEGSSWVLSDIPGAELESTPKPVTLNFGAEQKAGGHGGCNGFGGKYVQEGNKLHFSQMISTKMACMPGLKTENAYMSALHETNSFVIREERLELQKDGTTLAILNRADNKK